MILLLLFFMFKVFCTFPSIMSFAPIATAASNLVRDVLAPSTTEPSPAKTSQPIPQSNSLALPTLQLPNPSPIPIPLQTGTSVVVPFSSYFMTLRPDQEVVTSQALSSLSQIAKIIAAWRDASVLFAEAVIFPNANAAAYPTTAELAWTPNDLVPSAANIHNYPLYSSYTVGTYNLGTASTLPLDLSLINPVIKSPIPYTNGPRLTGLCPLVNKDQVYKTGSVLVRGRLILSNPLPVAW